MDEIHTDIMDIGIEALLQYLIFESYFNFLLTSWDKGKLNGSLLPFLIIIITMSHNVCSKFASKDE